MFFDNDSAPKKNLSIPTFGDREYDGGRLKCTVCGNDYLHHNRVEVFECGEDAAHGLHVVVDGGAVTTDTKLNGNPSSRRHGLRVHFLCEGCNVRSFMEISQHKGNTYVGMGTKTADVRE
jgi:hypothetical protein